MSFQLWGILAMKLKQGILMIRYSSLLQCQGQGPIRPGASAGGPEVQYSLQLLQPEIRLRQRIPARGDQCGALADPGHRLPGAGPGGRAPHHRGRHRRPGDPFANPKETLETLRLIRQRFPELLLCLASNGLGLPPYLDELAELQVSHVTITVNTVDPEIGAKIYSWVRDGKVIYRGRQAAEVLLARQLEAIAGLKARGIVVKINTIVIPGINDHHVEAVARKMAGAGGGPAQLHAGLSQRRHALRRDPRARARRRWPPFRPAAGEFLPQMRHCTRCRADAVGLLDADRTEEFRGCLSACAQMPPPLDETRPYVAVASREGVLVNLHLGEADSFQIWGPEGQGFRLLEERPAPPPGGGGDRWWAMAEILERLPGGAGQRPGRDPGGHPERSRRGPGGDERLHRGGSEPHLLRRAAHLPEGPQRRPDPGLQRQRDGEGLHVRG